MLELFIILDIDFRRLENNSLTISELNWKWLPSFLADHLIHLKQMVNHYEKFQE